MKVLNPVSWGTALGAGLIATVAMLPQAKGDLVYENGSENAAAAKIEDRSNMRQALGASEKVQVTLQTQQQPAAVAAPVDAVAPVQAATGPTVSETENMSKAELMRRERQREELKNEDILQERLEELRLRDERRRTQEVLNAGVATGAVAQQQQPAPAAPVTPAAQAPLQSEVVTAPVTEHPGKPSVAPVMAPSGNTTSGAMVDSVSTQQSMSMSVAPGAEGVADRSERTTFTVAPHAGIANVVGDSGYLQVSPHFAGGVSASMGTGDYFSFEVGYTYSQYGVSMASSNPFAIQAQYNAAATGQSNFPTINMNKNVFDAGVKIHLLGPDSKIRPYIGGGGAYSTSYINFASTILSQMNATYHTNLSPDYKVNNFMGYLSTGADFKVSKSISVGAEFRYYAVFSDSESGDLSSYSNVFYGGYASPYGYSGVNAYNQDTAIAGNSLARSSLYSIMGNVTFNF